MQKFRITDLAELENIAGTVLKMLKERHAARKDGAAVLALHGDLGSGKTAFMQSLARQLGVKETVTSPTFVVMKKYDSTDDVFSQFVHIDAHRIEKVDEMRALRFREELIENGSIIGIEWAEKLAELLPAHTLHVYLELNGETRTVRISDGQEG